MIASLSLFAFFLGTSLVSAQECTIDGDVSFFYSFVRDESDNPTEDYPPNVYETVIRNTIPSDDCSHFSVDYGYKSRKCLGCAGNNPFEYLGAAVGRVASETAFGRELAFARADLLDIGFMDADGNRADEKTLDRYLFPELDCLCEGEPIEEDTGSCPSPLTCSTSSPTDYGSVGFSFDSTIEGDHGIYTVNVSIVHDSVEGSPFFVLAVSPRFKTSTEEDGSIVFEKDEVRYVLSSTCGDAAVSVESVGPPERYEGVTTQDPDINIPNHNRVVLSVDTTNLTCEWSYSVEIELEKESAAAAIAAPSVLLVVLAAILA